MRILIIGFVLFLTACNSSGVSQQTVDSDIQTSMAKLQAQITALQASNDALKAGQAKLTLIGKLHGVTTDAVGRAVDAVGNPVSFGPCADMGVLVGFTNGTSNAPADPLTAQYQAFKQCTGYYYEVSAADGNLAPTQRLYFDGPNCNGSMFVWSASGFSFNNQVLSDGVVFISPKDGSQLMAKAGQAAVMTQVQSVYIIANGGCTADGDFQPMYAVTPNDISVSGVPESVGQFQLAAP